MCLSKLIQSHVPHTISHVKRFAVVRIDKLGQYRSLFNDTKGYHPHHWYKSSRGEIRAFMFIYPKGFHVLLNESDARAYRSWVTSPEICRHMRELLPSNCRIVEVRCKGLVAVGEEYFEDSFYGMRDHLPLIGPKTVEVYQWRKIVREI